MMKFVISRNRGAYYVSPPQGDALGQEVAEASGKEEPGTYYVVVMIVIALIRSLHHDRVWSSDPAQDTR